MEKNQYKVFESAAAPAMLRVISAVRGELAGLGHKVDRPSSVVHEFERGFGFEFGLADAGTPFSLEFMLTDCDERGFERSEGKPECGLLLSVIRSDGVFLGDWCPFNYSEKPGTSDPSELVRRVGLLEPSSVAASIHARISSWSEGLCQAHRV